MNFLGPLRQDMHDIFSAADVKWTVYATIINKSLKNGSHRDWTATIETRLSVYESVDGTQY